MFVSKPEDIDPESYVVALYYVESDLDLTEAGVRIAEEQSIGTWTEVSTLTEGAQRLAAKVFKSVERSPGSGLIWVAYPLELFDLESGVPNVLSVVAGNLFGLSSLRNVRLLDVEFPKDFVQEFPGPKFGIEGVREIVGTLEDRRPHIGTIVKPKVGLNPKETAEVAYEAAVGGVDLVKDDETLTNQSFCPIKERLPAVMEALDRVREETGRTVLYALNITARPDRLLDTADWAVESGANMLMVDVLTAGFSVIRVLAEDPSIRVPIHVHRTMHAAITRNPKHGIDMMVVAKLVRLVGGDQLHTGTAAGKMESDVERLKEINGFLRSDWHGLKTVFPVASGGIHPALVPENVRVLGRDIVIQAGGGIHGHPMGTRAGAKAMKQAVEAVMAGVPLEEYAKSHPELRAALEKWAKQT